MVTTTWIGGTDNMQWSNPNVDPIFNPWNTSSNWDNGIPGMDDVAILNNTSTTSYIVDVASLVLNNSSLLVSNSLMVGYLYPGSDFGRFDIFVWRQFYCRFWRVLSHRDS